MTQEPYEKSNLSVLIDLSERVVYYGAALALIVTLGMFFYSTAVAILGVVEEGTLKTSLTVLGRVLLILIFVELLATIGTIVREREVVAERGVPGPRSSDLGPKGVVRLSTEARGRCALRRSAFSSPDNPARVLSRQPTRPARGRLSVGPSEVIYPVRGRRYAPTADGGSQPVGPGQ